MVEVANLLGIEVMTGHWEFTYGEKVLRRNLEGFKGEFLAQNVFLTDEAAFNNAPAFDSASGRVFKPATIKELDGYRIGIIGQAMPYVPIAHPKRFTPDWTFGIRDAELQKVVDGLRQHDKVDAVLLLSHNGMDVDLKLASRVTGIDVILGGHTHDAVPQPTVVTNAAGKTLVTNAGSNGKFLGVLDLDIGKGRVKDVRYRLIPIYADLLPADRDMQARSTGCARLIAAKFAEKLATADDAALSARQFYRTDGSNNLRCAARNQRRTDRAVARLPLRHDGTRRSADHHGGFAGRDRDHLPAGLCDGHDGRPDQGRDRGHCRQPVQPDPYYQQGGDMVRVGGMDYTCAPAERVGRRISDMTLTTAPPWKPIRAIASPAGPRSTRRPASR